MQDCARTSGKCEKFVKAVRLTPTLRGTGVAVTNHLPRQAWPVHVRARDWEACVPAAMLASKPAPHEITGISPPKIYDRRKRIRLR